MAKTTMVQPPFDHRITNLAFPMEGKTFGNLRRGFMVWEKAPVGGLNKKDAKVNFLYNPATVNADFAMNYSVTPALQFPVPGDQSILRVPLSQTAEFSLLYDRTYELWGSYNAKGHPRKSGDVNDPAKVGVMADIYQMQQFTGMTISYSQDNGKLSTKVDDKSFNGHQGILQLIPSFVYFGEGKVLGYFGYISEWGYQITHWTQKMVPMRCVINISWTMLPYEQTPTGTPGSPGLPGNGPRGPVGGPLPVPKNVGGR